MTLIIDTTITGIHSRSENTVKTSRDFDRGRTSKDALDAAFKSDSENLVNLELASGITHISDGQLLWQDFLRPFSESVSGMRNGADLSRWFDNNSFYRKPSVVKKLSAPEDASFLENYLVKSAIQLSKSRGGKAKTKLSLLGPYTLASLVADDHYESKRELVDAFAKILKRVVRGLPALGFDSVQINEPSLVYRYGVSALTSKKELKYFLSAYEEYLSKPRMEVCLHTYFGDCSKILKDLIKLDGVNAIGVDFTQTSLDSLENIRFGEKTLACGCVDGRNSLVEPAEWIANFCAEAIDVLKPSGIVILPSSELKYLPRTFADEKIKTIGRFLEKFLQTS